MWTLTQTESVVNTVQMFRKGCAGTVVSKVGLEKIESIETACGAEDELSVQHH